MSFYQGTQSSNPHNDYCQHFIDTGQRPQNFIRDVGLADRFEEYPKLRELIKLKDDLIVETATPPMYLKTDLLSYNLKELNGKFDVILIEPPLEEYQRTCGATNVQLWNWDQVSFNYPYFYFAKNEIELTSLYLIWYFHIHELNTLIVKVLKIVAYYMNNCISFSFYHPIKVMELDIGEVAANRSFVFLWCGSSDGLDMGRFCLRKWGFRRCEDICWIRTNINNPGHSKNLDSKAVLQRTKEHCLMGIKGTVRRSTDGDFIHANVDIDLIISEEPDYGSIEKPVEIFHIIEHFCLGRRRYGKYTRNIYFQIHHIKHIS